MINKTTTGEVTPRKQFLPKITTTFRTISTRYSSVKHYYVYNPYWIKGEVISVLEKALWFDFRGVFRTQWNTYDGAFFVKSVTCF